MTEYLRAEMLDMEEDDCKAYVARLCRMTPFDLERQKNLARNKRLVMDLQLFGGIKRKKGKGKEKKAKRRKGDKEDWDADRKSDNSDSGEEEDGEEEVERPAVKMRSARRMSIQGATVGGSRE
ncbi:hypothetical protein K438DRAFT_1984291 [Mycena galopus ATCC 62051]|nr:hypothetical protein K438DRAFT_1984291 [Mycena galopus ATCC 62051]